MDNVSTEMASGRESLSGRVPAAADAVAIQSLVAAYFQRTDRPGPDPASDLFDKAGLLILGNLEISGREAIARFFQERNASQSETRRATRHISGGIELTLVDDNHVTGRSTAIVFAGSGEIPLPTGAPSTICDFDDIYVRTPDGWLFGERRAAVIFTGAGAAAFAK